MYNIIYFSYVNYYHVKIYTTESLQLILNILTILHFVHTFFVSKLY
jgi:hypothetical protein